MFRNLLSRLFTEDSSIDPLRGDDAEVAIAALLVRVARADDHYSVAEQQHIEDILSRRRGLSPREASECRVAAEMTEAEAPDTVRFTRLIKDRIALEDRQAVVGAMWEIACSDGKRDAQEDSQIRLIANLLGVSDRDSALARQQILGEMKLRDR